MKCIYMIMNNINKKVYIGQTNDPQKRFKEHVYGRKDRESIVHSAIKKYGEENFSFRIIEDNCEDYNEREKYWIKFYNANSREFGYNLTDGGEDPPHLKGDNCSWTIYPDDMVLEIQNKLLKTDESFESIASQYNMPLSTLGSINQGQSRYNSIFTYPIRKRGNERLEEELVLTIISELLYSHKSMDAIGREHNITSKVIQKINQGKHYYSPNIINYPIREQYNRYSNVFIKAIIQDLQNNQYTFYSIQSMYSISRTTLSRINNGHTYKQMDIKYPIR